ncbi:cell division protein FtsZ, partial [Porticoccaceae bacterium]|nr:cell division protein FtsZ [Porticoccaceae bacterium]
MFELVDSIPKNAEIKVVGVGGGGGNAVRHMMQSNIDGVDFICANTDAQSLSGLEDATILQLGQTLTKGLGAGANPEVGRQAALEDKDRIAQVLEGADMVFITAGMGGGTGTGGAPVIAEVAKQMGILTVGVVTRPFSFEGKKRLAIADEGIAQLKDRVDSLIIVPNEKLLQVLGKDMTVINAFKQANDVLFGAVQGIT